MKWKLDVAYIRDGYDKAIIDVDTEEVIVIVGNLDATFVNYIIGQHNKAVSLARKDGVAMAKEIYKSKS